jgi:hypothetical protein
MRHDGRRSGTLIHELLTGLVEMLPGGLGQRESTSFVERRRVCAQRSPVDGTARACLEHDTERQRSESIRERLVQRLVQVRGGSASSEAIIFIGLACSIETTSIEADESE